MSLVVACPGGNSLLLWWSCQAERRLVARRADENMARRSYRRPVRGPILYARMGGLFIQLWWAGLRLIDCTALAVSQNKAICIQRCTDVSFNECLFFSDRDFPVADDSGNLDILPPELASSIVGKNSAKGMASAKRSDLHAGSHPDESSIDNMLSRFLSILPAAHAVQAGPVPRQLELDSRRTQFLLEHEA